MISGVFCFEILTQKIFPKKRLHSMKSGAKDIRYNPNLSFGGR
jgi:hypothetical protein